jgi:hypothetical protein
MLNIDQKVKEFSSRSYDERLEISMNIITNLKDRWNTQAQELYDKISQMEKVPDAVINAIFQDFYDSVERIQRERVQSELHQFSKAWAYMEQLREKERQEREKEDADWILDMIDDL